MSIGYCTPDEGYWRYMRYVSTLLAVTKIEYAGNLQETRAEYGSDSYFALESNLKLPYSVHRQ